MDTVNVMEIPGIGIAVSCSCDAFGWKDITHSSHVSCAAYFFLVYGIVCI